MNRINKTILLTATILASLMFSACGTVILESEHKVVRGSGDVVEDTRTISGVSGVTLSTIGDLHIEVGSSDSLTIKAQENLLDYLETDVIDGDLRIASKDGIEIKSIKPIDYYLMVTDLKSIKLSSSGNVKAPDLKGNTFSIVISSSGDLEMGNIEFDTLSVVISSSGNVSITGGEVNTQEIIVSSSGKYKAKDLVSEKADVRISSSGSATIWVKEHLTATLNSSGDVNYRGNAIVDGSANSSGKVIHLGD